MNNKEQWLKERKTYVGGSDLGAILGLSPYRTIVDVYFEKTAEGIVEETTSPAAHWGNILEDVVAKEYSRVTSYKVEKPAGLIRHKEYPFIACNLDYWAVGSDGRSHILECKTANQVKASEWGREGSFDIPQSYQLQVAYYGAITGVEKVDIALLIGGQDFRIYTYTKDADLETKCIKAAKKFWNSYVVPNVPPKPKTAADTAKLYPKASGLEVRADADILEKVRMVQDLKAQEKAIDTQLETLQVDIKEYMQDAELLIDDHGEQLATWKNRNGNKRLDTQKLKEEHIDIYKQYLKEGSSCRVFSLKG